MTEPPELAAAREAFRSFIEMLDRSGPVVVLCHSDADGLASGAILGVALERLGFTEVSTLVTGKGENAYTPATRKRVKEAAPETLIVADLGCKAKPSVAVSVPTLFIDHHRPMGVPPEGTLITGYTWDPIPNASLLCFWLCGSVTTVDDLDWIAAVGTLSDLGDKAPFDILPRAKAKYTAKWLKEATSLVNAARRGTAGDAETGLRALLRAKEPKDLAQGTWEEARKLADYRAEVRAAFDEGKRASPTFSEEVALIRVNSACLIHPLVAQIWRRRLPKYVALVANEGYLPGRVAFALRTSSGVNLLDFLAQLRMPVSEEEGYMGHGHDQATSGILTIKAWNRLLDRMGFPPDVWAEER